MSAADLRAILGDHAAWLRGDGGKRADLRGADLRGADLSRADLRGADLSRADLSRADMSRADLSGADLSGADLSGADLSGADLSWANLRWANLRGTDLRGAIIRDGLKLGRNTGHASRGDQYTFFAFETEAGEPFIFAGCRAMLRSEYEAHIEAEYPGTDKARATRACLDYVCNLKGDFSHGALS